MSGGPTWSSNAAANRVAIMENVPAVMYARGREAQEWLQSEQVAQLHKQRVIGPLQPAEPERILILHVAAVPCEHHGSGDRLIAEQRIEVEVVVRAGLGAGHRRWPGNQDRRAGPRIIAQRVRLILDVLADESEEQRPRQLVLDLGAQNAADIHQAAVGATIHLLPEVADGIPHPLRGTIREVHTEEQEIGRRPFEEVFVVTPQEEPAAAEVLPLGRPDLNDVLPIPDRRLSDERDGVESAA